ncbi:MAG TPA: winged helix-turn-helix domain-containing protein [Terriglobales bacterium]|nr:winged helix-turn-helix domain-containing protein [Terriglobales bacterium]
MGAAGQISANSWTFLTNHAHVLICIARDPEARMRDIADLVGITERAVQRIVEDLTEAGYLEVEKQGRRNTYAVKARKHLRHPVEAHVYIESLLGIVVETGSGKRK